MAAPDEPVSSTRRTVEMTVLVVLVAAFLATSALVTWSEDGPKKLSWDGIGIFVAAGLTLVMYSFLYRDNPLFKVAENLYVGVTLGYGAIITWRQSLKREIVGPLFIDPPHSAAFLAELGRRIVPIILGMLLLTRLSRKYGWLSRYSYTLMVGWGAGIGIPIVAHSYILQQLHSAVNPLTGAAAPSEAGLGPWLASTAWPVLGAVVILAGMVSVLFYFFFSVEHKGAGRGISRLGILFLMVSFGASFGYTVMGRVSLLIGRVQFLVHDWLAVPK